MIETREEDYMENIEFKKIYSDYKLNLRKETEHFIIHCSEADNTCIEKVCDVLESSYSRITTIFNQKLEGKLTIEIHSDLKELHIALGFPNAPDWIRGGLGENKIVIASPLNPPPGSKFDNVLNTAVHEFIHIIVNKINKDTPRWLNEGIACYEAKDNDENWIRKTVKNGLVNNMIPTFKDLDTGEDFETFFNRGGYQYSYTIVESIVEDFSYEKLNSLIKSPKNFMNIFGIAEKKLEDNWIKYIIKKYS